MSDVKDGSIKENAEAVGEVIERKVGIIRRELDEALTAYQKAYTDGPEQGLDVDSEIRLMQAIARIGLVLNGLSTLFRAETATQLEFLRAVGVPESILVGKAADERVKALAFIERFVTEVNNEAQEKLGTQLPEYQGIRDAMTGKPLAEARKVHAGFGSEGLPALTGKPDNKLN
jgi:hypothetical protein